MGVVRVLYFATVATMMTNDLVAQTVAAKPGRRFSLSFGINRATFAGSDAEDADPRMGTMIGAGIRLPLTGMASFHPELSYTQKGARITDPTGDGTIEMNYVEVPVLLRFDLPVMGAVRPYVHGGPALAFQSACGISFSDGAVSGSMSCSEFAELVGDPSIEFKKFDVGLLGGAGIAFDVSGRTLTTGVRYTYGLQQVANEGDSKHRVLSFVASLELPFGK